MWSTEGGDNTESRGGKSKLSTVGDDNTEPKKGKPKCTSYSKISHEDVEEILDFPMAALGCEALPVGRMLAEAGYAPEGEDLETVLNTKEEVYKGIVRYLDLEGYPTELNPDFNEANIGDLVYATIEPILTAFKCKTGRNIRLLRGKEIAYLDPGNADFVVLTVDRISAAEKVFVVVFGGKESSFGQAMRQCLLAMKDMRDSNGGCAVFGFATTGDRWQMLRYAGGSFQMTRKFFFFYLAIWEATRRDG